jgi:hypothetical protein
MIGHLPKGYLNAIHFGVTDVEFERRESLRSVVQCWKRIRSHQLANHELTCTDSNVTANTAYVYKICAEYCAGG